MMNHISAVTMQVDSFSHHFAANQDVWKKRRVERSHETRTLVAIRLAGRLLDIGERLGNVIPLIR
jgi:hypothetical protein